MKIKRSLSILLMFTVIFSTLTFAIPSYAEVEEPFIDYVYYDDFSTTENMVNYFTGYNPTIKIWDTATNDIVETYKSQFSIVDGSLKVQNVTAGTTRVGFRTPTMADKPDLVLSFAVKLNFTTSAGYGFGSREQYGSGTLYMIDKGTITLHSAGSAKDTGARYTKGEWVTVTLVYDNESPQTHRRDIYINNKCYGTFENSSSGWDYAVNGYVEFLPQFYSKAGDSVQLDNIEVYAYPTELKYEVASASGKEVKLNFNMIPNAESVIPENFAVSLGDENRQITSAELSTVNSKQVILTLEEKLQPGTSYSVTASGITAGALTDTVSEYLVLESKEVGFETKPYMIYAENLKLYDGDAEATSLADGTYTVKTSFVNESEEDLTPVIAAGLYNDKNELKSLQLIPVEDAEAPIEEEITLSGTEGLSLKLFMLKDIEAPETVSSVSVYTASSAVTDGEFDPEVKMFRDTFDVATTVNGDTQVITTKVAEFDDAMARPATVIVLKNGKTLAEINTANPMETIVALDSIELSADGVSYMIPDVKSDYEAYIYLKNSDNYGHKTFTYYGINFMNAGREIIKDIEASEVDDFIADYKDAINLDTTEYDLMTADKETVAKSIEAQRKEKDTKEFASFDEFIQAYETAIELALMKTNSDVAEIIKGLEESVCKGLYEETISDEAITAAQSAIIADKPLTMNEFDDSFEKNVILKGVEKAENYSQTQEIMENTEDITGADLSTYEDVDDKKAVIVAISGKAYETLELLADAFEEAAEDQLEEEEDDSSSGGKGGSGGRGNSTSISSPIGATNIQQGAVSPTIVTPNIPLQKFNDLSGYEWAEEAINALADKGIVNGVAANTYNPGGEVKREEFVKMIDTLYTAESTTALFEDVNQSDWYAPYVNKAVAAGIIKGMSEESFGTGYGVTREDMAVMIYRVLKPTDILTGEAFADDSVIADYAKEAVYYLKNKGIISGTGNGNYEPKRIMTRAEAAVLINNILNIAD